MPSTNIFTEIVQEMQGEIANMRDTKPVPPVVPFMQEKMKPSKTLRQSDRMTPAQRQEVADSLGRSGVLKMLRGGKDA
jgi:hypothetical protein